MIKQAILNVLIKQAEERITRLIDEKEFGETTDKVIRAAERSLEQLKMARKKGYRVETIGDLMSRAKAQHKDTAKVILEGYNTGSTAYKNIIQELRWTPHEFTTDKMHQLWRRADWRGVHWDIRRFAGQLQKVCRRDNMPVYVHTCYRSPEEQKRLKEKGVSQLTDGPHNRSCAVDIVHADLHWNTPNEFWYYIGLKGMEIIAREGYNIRWGGNWDMDTKMVGDDQDESFWDPAHWEVINWKEYEHHTGKVEMTPQQLLM